MSSEYTVSFKKAMVQKMSGPDGVSAGSLSVETGVAQSPLSRCLRQYGTEEPGRSTMSNKKRPGNWSAEQKLATVHEYDALADEDGSMCLKTAYPSRKLHRECEGTG